MSTRLNGGGGNNEFPFAVGINGSSGTTGSDTVLRAAGTSVSSNRTTSAGSYHNYSNAEDSTASTFSSIEVYIPNYTNTTQNKPFGAMGVTENNSTSGNRLFIDAALKSATDAVTSIVLYQNNVSFTFVSGSSFYLYGISKS
jgi:hypothetical protein